MAEPAAGRAVSIVYLDALMVKVRDEGHIQNKAIYVVLGVNLEGQKEVLGLWVAQTERGTLLHSISSFFKFLPREQRQAFVAHVTEKAS